MQSATGSAAPIGDMMIMVGDALFGQGNGRTFMLVEAFTVILALIGTTLSCMNTGARVTYAMGKDNELSGNLGLLHSKNLTPHRAIWTLATISAIIGCVAVAVVFGDTSAPTDATIQALPHGIFSSFGYFNHDTLAALPNTLLMVTLASNFGTFVLYMLSCITCMVAFHRHPRFNPVLHLVHPALWPARQSRLHGLLPDRSVHGLRRQEGAAARARHRRRLGHLRGHLLPALEQEERAHHLHSGAVHEHQRLSFCSFA